MKIHISKLHEILDDELSLIQRGILITAMALRDDDSKLTLAKFKAKIKTGTIREELIALHEAEYIEWSEYKAAVRYLKNKEIDPAFIELIEYINILLRTTYKSNNKEIISMLKARLVDYDVSDIKKVFANRYAVWKDDPMMSKHLTPFTILRPSKFPKYFEEASKTKEGAFYVNVKEINLNPGDEITYELSKKLIDNDVYKIRIFNMQGFKRLGNGMEAKKYGRDIKKTLKNMYQSQQNGGSNDMQIIYNGN